ncbi:meiotic nuclear division protein 1 [Cytidiella melzeri]|nr:meiotic nuclear division protein 1 [Cytidiella melzeri]
MQNRLDTVKKSRELQQAQLAEVRRAITAEQTARPHSDERTQDLNKLESLKKDLEGLQAELAKFGACDPVKVEEKKRALILAKEAAVRWTDNYAVVLSYFTRQFSVDPEEIRKYLGIGEDYEDIS